MKSKISILITVLALAFTSCLKDKIVFDTDNLDLRSTEIGAPITTVHIPLYKSMEKWMDFENLFINADGVIYVKYIHSEELGWNDEIGVNNFLGSWSYDLGNLMSSPIPLTLTGSQTFPIQLTAGEETNSYVSEAELIAGNLILSFNVPENLDSWNIEITIPELSKNGVNYQQTFNKQLPETTINLNGYKINTANKRLNLNVTFTFTGASITGEVGIKCNLMEVDVSYLAGYFGRMEYIPEKSDTELSFDFFNDLDFDGTVGIRDINFEVELTNSIGVPMQFIAKEVSFVNENGGATKLINPFDLDIPAAKESGSASIVPGYASHSDKLGQIEFTTNNYPTHILFDFIGIANPDDNEIRNFIVKDGSNLAEAQLTLTVPLHIKMSSYNRADTVAFDYNNIINNDEEFSKSVESFTITLKVDNNLPFAVQLSADAIDKAGVIVEENIANININANQKNQPPITIELTRNQLEKFRTRDVKNIVLRSSSKTASEDYVKVTKDDYLDIAVSVKFESNIPNIF